MRGLEVAVTGLVVILGALLLLNVAVLRFGADSRDGNDWVEHPHP